MYAGDQSSHATWMVGQLNPLSWQQAMAPLKTLFDELSKLPAIDLRPAVPAAVATLRKADLAAPAALDATRAVLTSLRGMSPSMRESEQAVEAEKSEAMMLLLTHVLRQAIAHRSEVDLLPQLLDEFRVAQASLLPEHARMLRPRIMQMAQTRSEIDQSSGQPRNQLEASVLMRVAAFQLRSENDKDEFAKDIDKLLTSLERWTPQPNVSIASHPAHPTAQLVQDLMDAIHHLESELPESELPQEEVDDWHQRAEAFGQRVLPDWKTPFWEPGPVPKSSSTAASSTEVTVDPQERRD